MENFCLATLCTKKACDEIMRDGSTFSFFTLPFQTLPLSSTYIFFYCKTDSPNSRKILIFTRHITFNLHCCICKTAHMLTYISLNIVCAITSAYLNTCIGFLNWHMYKLTRNSLRSFLLVLFYVRVIFYSFSAFMCHYQLTKTLYTFIFNKNNRGAW